MKRVIKYALITIVALPLLLWGLLAALLPSVVRDQAQAVGDKLGYQIHVGTIDVNPLDLRVRLYDLSLAPKADPPADAGEPLLSLKQFEVDMRFLPLLTGHLSFEKIALDTPSVFLSRKAKTDQREPALWNWQRLIMALNQLNRSDAAADRAEESALKISVDALVIDAGRLAIRDGQQQASYDFGPFSLKLTDLSHHMAPGPGEHGLSSQYVLNLGQVIIPLPLSLGLPRVDGMPDRQLVFRQVMASGSLIESSAAELKVGLDLALDDGQIQSTWQLSPQGTLAGQARLTGLAVKPWLAMLPTYALLDSLSGTIDGKVSLQKDAAALTVDADLTVDALDIREVAGKEPLLAWASTTLNQFHLVMPQAADKPSLLTINEILVDRPKIRFVMNAQRQSNFRALFSQPEPQAAAQTQPVPQATPVVTTTKTGVKISVPVQTAPGVRYDIRTIRLKNGFMHFADEAITPVFRVDVTDLNGSLQGISNATNRYASLVLNGRAAKTGSLRARGQLAFADPRQNNDVSLVFRNIPLNATNPYTMTFAGYPIDDGRIDVDLRYVTKDGQLQGKNRFVIKKIKLGEPVPDYQGTRLPLGLAIALLEDSDGMIDVNIPVKGNVNEPDFSVGHLVWQAVKTVLTNVVTAPFRALGALLGIENIDAIAFVPGENALPPEVEEDLTKIAEYLAKRPKAKLVIHGTFNPSVDSAALARAMADKAILEASGIRVVAGEPLPLPNLTDPKVRAGLKSAYGAQVGRIQLGQRLLTLPDNAERDALLRQELIQSFKITDEQLKQLATQRANAVKAKLVLVDNKLAERISLADPETVTADDGGVPIRVVLTTQD